jgi:hypothetical protein|nr:MAG TPA: hypothetical protein [Caudoviricetes sp.]
MKLNIKRKEMERSIYILLIIGLTLYGLKDSETAERLIRSLSEAFSILINNP